MASIDWGAIVIDKVACQLAASFPVNQIANQVHEALAHSPGWTDLKARIASARTQAETFWSEVDLPVVPSLEEVRRYARERIAQTPSLEEIAVRAASACWSWYIRGSAKPPDYPQNCRPPEPPAHRSSEFQNPRHFRLAGVLNGSAASQSRLSCAIQSLASASVAKPTAVWGSTPVLVISTAKPSSSPGITR